MTWRHKPGRAWHYALPNADRFVCGSFFSTGNWEESRTVPERGKAMCIRCERLMLHALSGAMGYKGQSQRKVRGRVVGAGR